MQQRRDCLTFRFAVVHNIGVSCISLPLIYAASIVIHLLDLDFHLLIIVRNDCLMLLPIGLITI